VTVPTHAPHERTHGAGAAAADPSRQQGPSLGAWAGTRVLVTGHSGFLGSWLAVAARELGADVTGFASESSPTTRERDAWLRALGIEGVVGDVRDLDAVDAAVGAARPDVVVHLAAQPIVGIGFERPHETFEVNVQGSANVFEACRRNRVGVLLHGSSDKCYANPGGSAAFREDDRLGGSCPYSTSKAMAEHLFASYTSLDDMATSTAAASVRFGNVIGGGDEEGRHRLVPNCVASLRSGDPIHLQASSVRPFQHVLDVVRGMLLLGAGLIDGCVPRGRGWNFAPPQHGFTVGELAGSLATAWGSGGFEGTSEGPGFREEPTLRLDGTFAAETLGWVHQLDLDAGARAIVEWHRLVDKGGDPGEVTANQVAAFFATDDRRRQQGTSA
jgi:CDP-glucose 4,6-dehydratase